MGDKQYLLLLHMQVHAWQERLHTTLISHCIHIVCRVEIFVGGWVYFWVETLKNMVTAGLSEKPCSSCTHEHSQLHVYICRFMVHSSLGAWFFCCTYKYTYSIWYFMFQSPVETLGNVCQKPGSSYCLTKVFTAVSPCGKQQVNGISCIDTGTIQTMKPCYVGE